MEAAHRTQQLPDGQSGSGRERGAGDWQHYQPPSAVLTAAAAAKNRESQPSGEPVGLPGRTLLIAVAVLAHARV